MVFNRFEHQRLNHAGTMGMAITDGYTNQGIGTKLIELLLTWAKNREN